MQASWGLVALGLVVLVGGAELLVRGASRLAARFGVPPLVVGLTVVAFGTSAPELAVNLQAGAAGTGEIGLGNVLGSNVFNTLLILGLAAVVTPLRVQASLVRFEVPMVLVASVGAYGLAVDGALSPGDGVVLLMGMAGYSLLLLGSADAGPSPGARDQEVVPNPAPPSVPLLRQLLLVAGGLTLLVLGSRALVSGAVEIATAWGVSPLLIGLTVVAAGTSLPELATSFVASVRGEVDIAVGNVLGSNLFNLLFVLGATSLVDPGGVQVPPSVLRFDFPVLLGVALACFPIFVSRLEISRREGILFVLYYGAYVTYLILAATGHGLLDEYRAALGLFVLPLTVLMLLFTLVGSLKRPRPDAAGRLP